MAHQESSTPVQTLNLPKLQALTLQNKLSPAPKGKAKYTQTVKNQKGEDVLLGDPKVTRGLVAVMNMHAVMGGAACHWGGPAAFAEIMSALHGIMFKDCPINPRAWYERYHFVNDTGHAENGIYALRANLGFDNLKFEDLWKFRSIESKLTGHGESHLNPEGVLISNGPLGSGVPAAQGLCMADKILGINRTTFCAVSDGALMEGETKEALSAIPGLASKGKMNPFVLLVSYNNTKLSGRIDEDSFSMEPSLDAIGAEGWSVLRIKEGHDLQKVYTALETGLAKAKAHPEKPVCIIFHTIKGYGVKSTEKSASGGHGFPLSKGDGKLAGFVAEIFGGEDKVPGEFKAWTEQFPAKAATAPSIPKEAPAPKDKVQSGVAKALIKAAQDGLPVYSVSADLQSSTGVKGFHSKCPDRFVEVGIAESNMMNVAIGLSACGLIPVVDTFAQFAVTKGNLPLTMASLSETPMIGILSHTGFQDAADGASHQATTYFAAIGAIPHVDVVSLATSGEAEAYVYAAIKNIAEKRNQGKKANSVIFFLGRENYPIHLKENIKYEWGKPNMLGDEQNADLLIVGTGPTVFTALTAAEELRKTGLKVQVINNCFVNYPDTMLIGRELEKAKGRLITIEDHQVIGGMGERLSHALSLAGYSFKIKSLGIKGHFGRSAYTSQELYDLYHLGVKDILEAAKNLTK